MHTDLTMAERRYLWGPLEGQQLIDEIDRFNRDSKCQKIDYIIRDIVHPIPQLVIYKESLPLYLLDELDLLV